MAVLRYGIVTFKGRPVGRLHETIGGGSVFTYDAGVEQDIACALPASQREHDWPAGPHPFFQHLGPEGWLRARQARTANIDADDDLGLLLRFGADGIGAVGIEDPGETAPKPVSRDLDALTRAVTEGKWTLSGVQPKLLARREVDRVLPAPSGPAPLIAKFPTEDLPSLVANELLSMKLATVLLGREEVAEVRHGRVEGVEKPALLVQRFDCTPGGSRLRFEDFAQVLARPRGLGFAGKYDADFEEVGEAIRRHSAKPVIDLFRFFHRIVVFGLLGNCDCHLKNFALLERPDGLRLSPAYDVVNSCVYARQGYATRFGLRIEGREVAWKELDRDLLHRLGRRLGLAEAAVRRTFSRLAIKEKAVMAALPPAGGDSADDWQGLFRAAVVEAWERILE